MTGIGIEPPAAGPPGNRSLRFPFRRPDQIQIMTVARRAWLVAVALSITLLLIDLPSVFRSWRALNQYQSTPHETIRANLAQLGLSTTAYAAYLLALALILALTCFTVGLLIGLRRAHQPMALFVAWLLVTLGSASLDPVAVAGRNAIVGRHEGVLYWLNFLMNWVSFETVVLLLLLFPDFRFLPSWSRWLIPLTLIWWLVPVSNGWLAMLNLSFVTVVLAISVRAQLYRYRRISDAVQRQQARLVADGFALAGIAFVFDRLVTDVFRIVEPGTLTYMIESALVTVCLLCIPASFGIAIMRYHLWDIDLIINRTLVYAPLTALLAGLYAGLVKLFQELFQQVAGPNSLAIGILTTIIVAATFTPLKNAVQTLVDRHVKVGPRTAALQLGVGLAAAGAGGRIPAPGADVTELRGEIAELRAEMARLELRLPAQSAPAATSSAHADSTPTPETRPAHAGDTARQNGIGSQP